LKHHEWPGDAVISGCGEYRYQLWRSRPGSAADVAKLVYVMLNPSTATGLKNDPTIRKCQGFAERLGYERFVVVNAYAYRSTDPKWLYEEMKRRPLLGVVGPLNDAHIAAAFAGSDRIVAAWGVNKIFGRARVIQGLASAAGKRLEAIELTKEGHPRHPLMPAYRDSLVPYEVAP
jgi:hypothetical protein